MGTLFWKEHCSILGIAFLVWVESRRDLFLEKAKGSGWSDWFFPFLEISMCTLLGVVTLLTAKDAYKQFVNPDPEVEEPQKRGKRDRLTAGEKESKKTS